MKKIIIILFIYTILNLFGETYIVSAQLTNEGYKVKNNELLVDNKKQKLPGTPEKIQEIENQLYKLTAKKPSILDRNKMLKKTEWNFSVGSKKDWWSLNETNNTYEKVAATCRAIGEHCYIFVQDVSWDNGIDANEVSEYLEAFETKTPIDNSKGIYDKEVEVFGNPPNEIDGDSKIIILFQLLAQSGGYFTFVNEYSQDFLDNNYPSDGYKSNEAEMIYVNTQGSTDYNKSVLAHELQHMINWNYHKTTSQSTFLNEGCSEIAQHINGYPIHNQVYESNIPLFTFRRLDIRDYSRAARFILYFDEQFGSEFLTKLVQDPDTGIIAIDNSLANLTTSTTRRFDDILPDWFLANIIGDKTVDSKYGYDYLGLALMETEDCTNSSNYSWFIYGTGVQYISRKDSRYLALTFSTIPNNIKVKAYKRAIHQIIDVPIEEQVVFDDFGQDYDELIFVMYNTSAESLPAISIFALEPSITLNIPNGGETWMTGVPNNIEWSSSNIENVKIEFSIDNGATWTVITNSTPALSGTYRWTIPSLPTSKCKMRISDANNSPYYDISEHEFSIFPIFVNKPNGGESWSVNSTQQIQWNCFTIDNIKIEYSTNGGTDWITIIASTSEDAGTYSWNVPNSISNNCKIRISDVLNSTSYDISDNVFSISGWSFDPNANNPICTAQYNQWSPKIISDGIGGAIVAWPDCRSGNWNDIYAQKINSNGFTQWQTNGIAIRSREGLFYPYQNLAIVSDGNGGAISTWGETSNEISPLITTYHNIFAQKIYSNGNLGWAADGVAVCTAMGDQIVGQIISDGNGGAIITWADSRSGSYDIYTQRINANGIVQWLSDGIAICTESNNQSPSSIVSDGNGGAIITWVDRRNNNNDIYSQRINSNGMTQWESSGVPVCTVSNNISGFDIATANDGNGGVFITWKDNRIGNINVYAQRINSSGITQWESNGVLIGTHYDGSSNPTIVSDGNGGAIIAWLDTRSLYGVYAQRINSSGQILWASNGVYILNNGGSGADQPCIVSDNNGGAIIISSYNSGSPMYPNWDIYGQRINSSGSIQWASGGSAIGTAPGNQTGPAMISDNNGGAIVVWSDYYDIYASKINSKGILGEDAFPLPVELSSFTATINKDRVNLIWQTETEINNYGFEIERKTEVKAWIKIGFVPGDGNSNSQREYSFTDDNPPSGKVIYRLKQIDFEGEYEYSNEIKVTIAAPAKLSMNQNYPNPFNPLTKISFSIPEKGFVKINIFDVLGKELLTLVSEEKQPGNYQVEFNGSKLSSGVYFYRLQLGNSVINKKMLLIK